MMFPVTDARNKSERRTTLARSDAAECLRLLRAGSKSFYAASLLLPRRLRCDVYSLYAFCRIADDEVDLSGGPGASVAILRARLEALYAGDAPQGPVERAFASLVRRRNLPMALPLALIEGFEWDAAGRSYETLSEVRAYGVRVAGVVGMMMSFLMGVRSAEALARACDLGVAMQLTNIARDIGEDARAGRLYLPRAWFRDAGLDVDLWLADPRPCPEVARMTIRLLDEAGRLYRRAESGIAMLPADARPAIWAARKIYAEIGAQIRRNGFDNVNQRAVVSKSRKVVLLGGALSSSVFRRRATSQPALREAAAFIHAAALEAPQRNSLGERVVWTIDLFHRLAEAEQERRVASACPRGGEAADGASV
ncbi:MAG: phytoene/squalene synthase family protein [Beijerinckiaceae bacterium]